MGDGEDTRPDQPPRQDGGLEPDINEGSTADDAAERSTDTVAQPDTVEVTPSDRDRRDRRWGPPTGQRTPGDWVRWFWRVDHGPVAYLREMLISVGVVVLIGVILFAVSGVWPPMVAIESQSMEPNIQQGDLVFVMEETRFAGPGATTVDGRSTGVITLRVADRNDGYGHFGRPGDVIVYEKDGRSGATPIIHRAHFWVNDSENWYDKADPAYVGTARNCQQLRNCPAPHGGFITKGDNARTNAQYDQASGISSPVRPGWIIGTAEFRVPLLGYVRLGLGTALPRTLLGTIGGVAGLAVVRTRAS